VNHSKITVSEFQTKYPISENSFDYLRC